MARFATISEIESTEIVICRLKSIITEYYFRETLQRDFTERDFISYAKRERFEERYFISYTEREILQVIQRETSQVIRREPDRELRNEVK